MPAACERLAFGGKLGIRYPAIAGELECRKFCRGIGRKRDLEFVRLIFAVRRKRAVLKRCGKLDKSLADAVNRKAAVLLAHYGQLQPAQMRA